MVKISIPKTVVLTGTVIRVRKGPGTADLDSSLSWMTLDESFDISKGYSLHRDCSSEAHALWVGVQLAALLE